MPTAIVTGGAGFIGSHLAERFLREGWTVHVIDNLVTGKRENLPADASFHELDIRDAEGGGARRVDEARRAGAPRGADGRAPQRRGSRCTTPA